MKNLFLETGVIADFLCDNSRLQESTAVILTLAELKQLKVFVSPSLYNILYCQFVKTEGHKKIVEKLRKLNSITRTLKVNKKMISQALIADIENLDAALQYYAVKSNKKIEAIITNNPAAFGHCGLALQSPDTFLAGFWNSKT